MSSNNNGDLREIINELKNGSVLTKQKRNGEQYSRLFYLDEHENFVSYHQSEKILAQAHRCKFYKNSLEKRNMTFMNIDYIGEMDEVRIGFHSLTIDELVKQPILDSDEVSYSTYP
jgi:hypothetical protein